MFSIVVKISEEKNAIKHVFTTQKNMIFQSGVRKNCVACNVMLLLNHNVGMLKYVVVYVLSICQNIYGVSFF